MFFYLLVIRGHHSWKTPRTAGDRGNEELSGTELEATGRERTGGRHVLRGKGKYELSSVNTVVSSTYKNILQFLLQLMFSLKRHLWVWSSHSRDSVPDLRQCEGHQFDRLCLPVCLRHRQLAEGQHRDPSQVSSLRVVRSRRREVLQIPCPVLQLRRCRWTIWPNRGHHRGRQAWWGGFRRKSRRNNSFLYTSSFLCCLCLFCPVDIPSAPSKVVPTRNTDTSVVVSWEASRDAKELVGYYIEGSIVGSNVWEPCNNKPVNATRWNTPQILTFSNMWSIIIFWISVR